MPKPFHKLDAGTWLHDRPETDVYTLLLDAFLLRLNDDYTIEGDVWEDTVHAGSPTSTPRFKKFLALAEKRKGLLPPWWNKQKSVAACVAYGTGAAYWSSLASAPEKSDFVEQYAAPNMPMQLRMFAEVVYQHGPAGQDSGPMRRQMMMVEGTGMTSSMMDMSSMMKNMGV